MHTEKTTRLELEIARQCAPVLAGVKPSNLLILEQPVSHPAEALPAEAGISTRLLYQSEQTSIWLLYREEELLQILETPETVSFLKEWGYKDTCMGCKLEKLAARFTAYREKKQDFPHEMGVFLGYPLGDVKGFITYGGKNYLYSGYWKVYENVEETKKQFQLFETVKKSLIEAVKNGMGLVPQPVI